MKIVPVWVTRHGPVVEALVDDEDWPRLSPFRWRLHKDGYAYRQERVPVEGGIRVMSCLMHRVIMETPEGWDTDHINRNRLDNQRDNLRIIDRAQNNYNSGLWRNNTSGHKGVSWSKQAKAWRAYIGGVKARLELGCFKNIEDAIAARRAAEEQIIELP